MTSFAEFRLKDFTVLTTTISSMFRAILGFFGRMRSEMNSSGLDPLLRHPDVQALFPAILRHTQHLHVGRLRPLPGVVSKETR